MDVTSDFVAQQRGSFQIPSIAKYELIDLNKPENPFQTMISSRKIIQKYVKKPIKNSVKTVK